MPMACGVLVSVADIRAAVADTPSVDQKTLEAVLRFVDRTWGEQETVDVMMMAMGFWNLRYEFTSDTAGLDAIMDRIKDEKLVPTIGREHGTKH